MCGIFGAVSKNNIYYKIKPALERLSYRGYDSAGIAALYEGKYEILKCLDDAANLEDIILESNVAVGHTRWATHGAPSILNAHPHLSNDQKIALVHNGTTENYPELKEFLLKKGYQFYSETDTEIIANLLQYHYEQSNNIETAIKLTNKEIVGAYAIVFIHTDFPDRMYAVAVGSPICIGKSNQNDVFVASSKNCLPNSTIKARELGDKKMAILYQSGRISTKLLSGQRDKLTLQKFEISNKTYDKGSFNSFYEKEIHEQVECIRNFLRGRVKLDPLQIKLSGIIDNINDIINAQEVIFTGCGSALYAAQIGSMAMESMARIRSRAVAAGELKYYNPVIDKRTVMLAVSQSGETADTLGCVREAKERGAIVLGIINVPSSVIAREVASGIHIRAGTEVSVASTKAVTNQILTMVTLAALVSYKKDLSPIAYESIIKEMYRLPETIRYILSLNSHIRDIIVKYKDAENLLCIGRNALAPVAGEIALKIKEISYIHAEGYSAAELKHGPLALISEKTPTIVLVGNKVMAEKTLSNIREIKSRGGRVIAVVEESECLDKIIDEVDDYIKIPDVNHRVIGSISYIVVGQLIALHFAELNGRNVDKPRNLAKSVSVE